MLTCLGYSLGLSLCLSQSLGSAVSSVKHVTLEAVLNGVRGDHKKQDAAEQGTDAQLFLQQHG